MTFLSLSDALAAFYTYVHRFLLIHELHTAFRTLCHCAPLIFFLLHITDSCSFLFLQPFLAFQCCWSALIILSFTHSYGSRCYLYSGMSFQSLHLKETSYWTSDSYLQIRTPGEWWWAATVLPIITQRLAMWTLFYLQIVRLKGHSRGHPIHQPRSDTLYTIRWPHVTPRRL